MNAVVIEHVRVEEEAVDSAELPNVSAVMANPLFGMWHDREDMADVEGYVRGLRRPRFSPDRMPHAD